MTYTRHNEVDVSGGGKLTLRWREKQTTKRKGAHVSKISTAEHWHCGLVNHLHSAWMSDDALTASGAKISRDYVRR